MKDATRIHQVQTENECSELLCLFDDVVERQQRSPAGTAESKRLTHGAVAVSVTQRGASSERTNCLLFHDY
jgi:hypothetical protein